MGRHRVVPGLSKRLKEALLSSGLNTYEIERQTGISHTAISRYCTEDMVPSVFTIYALSDLLGVTANYLIFGEENKHE